MCNEQIKEISDTLNHRPTASKSAAPHVINLKPYTLYPIPFPLTLSLSFPTPMSADVIRQIADKKRIAERFRNPLTSFSSGIRLNSYSRQSQIRDHETTDLFSDDLRR